MSPPRKIIDSHLDLSWNALSYNRDLTETIEQVRQRETGMTDNRGRGRCTVSLPEMRRGGVCVCLGTVLCRTNRSKQPMRRIDLDVANQDIACAIGRGQLEYYRLLEERGEIRLIKTRGELQSHFENWTSKDPIGMIIAMEGADPIVSPRQAERWFADGLRSVGMVHYGRSAYAVGTGDYGPLTPAGVEMLKEFARLGMIVDMTHSSDQSFFQTLDVFPGPVLASHNNCRALVPGDRQYSDEQIKLLISRGGVIGSAFDAWMCKPGFVAGQSTGEDVPLTNVIDHIDHICNLAGNTNHVAIGSDLDGGFGNEQTPAGIDTIADLQKLAPLLRERRYSETDIDKIFHGNWLRFFSEALPK